MGSIGLMEILLILGVLILIFGASQIPKIARSLGEGLKELKKGIKEAKDMDDEDNDNNNDTKK
jgi:sec-independent protein translocase protein TatA